MSPPKGKVQIHPYITADLKKEIDTLVKTRGIAISDIADAALQAYIAPEDGEPGGGAVSGLVLRRLERLTQSLNLVLQNLDITVEAVAMLARVYLSTTLSIPEAAREQARREGGAPYRAYIQAIAQRLRKGQTLLSDLPDDLFRPDADNHSTSEGDHGC